ncbi:MAG: fructose-specific PTS transporter subunit EIIC [Moraxellaceae bacterium]|nr:fructose-specific PTS transporter subunit EIIC [Moraxellaceae bacterium]
MKNILIYISSKVGMAQAQLAFLNLQKVAESNEQNLSLQHGGSIKVNELADKDGLVVIGDYEFDDDISETFASNQQTIEDAINKPEKVLAQANSWGADEEKTVTDKDVSEEKAITNKQHAEPTQAVEKSVNSEEVAPINEKKTADSKEKVTVNKEQQATSKETVISKENEEKTAITEKEEITPVTEDRAVTGSELPPPLPVIQEKTTLAEEKSVVGEEKMTIDIEKRNESINNDKLIVGITSCPTGIAHTFMAAEALEVAGKELGYNVKIETQGSVGAENTLTDEEITKAEFVIIAADVGVDLERFVGKKVYSTNTKSAINDGVEVVKTALANASVHESSASDSSAVQSSEQTEQTKQDNSSSPSTLSGIYKHLMTGVSHMLPFVVAGGLLIALGFALGSFEFGENGIHIYKDEYRDTLGATLFWIGKAAFALFVPILGGYISYSIAGRAGLAAGMVGGYMAAEGGSGFLGAILAGFIAGYVVLWMTKNIKLPKSFAGLMPVLIIPLFSVLIVGLLMHYVVGEPVTQANQFLTAWLGSMKGTDAAILGLIVGGMMAFDMGGPVNKAAYVFATGLLGEYQKLLEAGTSVPEVTALAMTSPMAAVMAAGMTPPLAIFVASLLFKNRFLEEEREAAKSAGVLGLSFITEGAIPFAARDPFRVIPALMAGSAVAGALSMYFSCGLKAPHGGVFVLFIPNAVSNLAMYVVAILAGTAVTALLLGILKKPVETTVTA